MLKLSLFGVAVWCFTASIFVGCTCQTGESPEGAIIDSGFAQASVQLTNMLDTVAKYKTDNRLLPKSVGKDGKNTLSGIYEWIFPGFIVVPLRVQPRSKVESRSRKMDGLFRTGK